MDFIPEDIQQYANEHSTKESALLHQLNRSTYQKVLQPRMLSGHFQGRVLSMMSHMLNPTYILEIGTYTGYSALCLAEGLHENGSLHTIDINDELSPIVTKALAEGGASEKVKCHWENALEVIPTLPNDIDLVFIDADKENYSAYFDLVFPKLKMGGHILADNVLWSGKVVKPTQAKDKETKAIKAFNEKIAKDDRVDKVLLPIRDGLFLIRKIKS